jgi:Family of unknown function (DUF6152)
VEERTVRQAVAGKPKNRFERPQLRLVVPHEEEAQLTNKLLSVFTMVASFIMVSAQLFAHHGASNYDWTRTITVKGIVTEFEWTNPHALIHFDVTDENGKVEKWVAQETSLNMLSREGWNRNTLKPGDPIIVIGHPFKNGTNYILGRKMILANGREYTYDGK